MNLHSLSESVGELLEYERKTCDRFSYFNYFKLSRSLSMFRISKQHTDVTFRFLTNTYEAYFKQWVLPVPLPVNAQQWLVDE